jgi:hypothetical protein
MDIVIYSRVECLNNTLYSPDMKLKGKNKAGSIH